MLSEALFTPSGTNPDCPNTNWWTAADVDSTEAEVSELVAAFVRAIQPELVLETGCWHGFTTAAIAQALARNGHGRLVSVELHEEVAAIARQRCAGFNNTSIVVCDSLTYTPD